MTTPTDRIKQLQADIERAQREIVNCPHTLFTDVAYDPDTVREGYGYHLDKENSHGSDPVFSFEGYTNREVPRWSKTCKSCGKKIYTAKQKPTGMMPDFGD